MRISKSLVTLSLIGSMSLACGSKDDDSSSAVAADHPLVGTWESSCISKGDDDSSKTVWVVSDNVNFKQTDTTYSDTTCVTEAFTLEMIGTWTAGAASTVVTDAKDIDLKFTKINATPKTAAFVSNLSGICGKTDWAVDTTVDLVPIIAACEKIGLTTSAFDIYKIDAKTVYLGKNDDTYKGTTSATRPITLETEFLTKK